MIFPLDTILAARLLGIGKTPKGTKYPRLWPVILGTLNPSKLGSFKHNPKQTETTFSNRFSNAFQLGILASELQGQEVPRWCCLQNPWLSAQSIW